MAVLLIGYPPLDPRYIWHTPANIHYRFEHLEDARTYTRNPPAEQANFGWSAHPLRTPQ